MTASIVRAAGAGISILATLGLPIPAASLQQPASGSQVAIRTGFIAGQVIELPSGRPVPEAIVRIATLVASQPGAARGSATQAIPLVATDAQGRFFFANLPAGRFTVSAGHPGFEPSSGGAPVVELAAGERIVDVKIRMIRFASIAGILRDQAGDPVVNTEVILLKRAVVNGRRTLRRAATIRSDDRGEYRISRLDPGEYVVCACSRDPNPFDGQLLTTLASEPANLMTVAARALVVGPDVVSLDDRLLTYAPTFHPNSATIARASIVNLAPGDEQTGIDITLGMVRATRVSGRVAGAQSAVQAQSMRLIPALDADAGIEIAQIPPMLVQPDGRFDFAGVPPGQYRLIVMHRETGTTGGGPSGIALGFAGGRGIAPPPPPPPPSGDPSAASALLWADDLITVPDDGLSGIVIGLNRPTVIRGHVQLTGTAQQPSPESLGRFAIILQPVTFNTGMGFTTANRLNPDATFVVPGAPPGKYIVGSTTVPGFTALKSIVVNGVDITDLPLNVERRDIDDLTITFADTPLASLSVSVPPVAGTGLDGASVLLFPVDSKYWAEPAAARRRFRVMSLSTKGTASASDLPSGDYFVVFASELDAADWQEPSKIEVLSRRAQRITLLDGDQKTIEVRR